MGCFTYGTVKTRYRDKVLLASHKGYSLCDWRTLHGKGMETTVVVRCGWQLVWVHLEEL